jgi:signal transduction histidine kinase
VAVAALVVWRDVLDYQGRAINIPFLVALYTVAMAGTVRRTVIVGVGVSLIAVARTVVAGNGWIGATTSIGWTISALLFGESMRARAEIASDADSRARRAEAEREFEVERRVTEERLRIARELHDVIAHTVSVMTVQTGVAADVLGDRPDEAREALATVRSASREANRELRALVGLLRSPEGGSELAPAPGLGDIAELVRTSENAGVTTDITESGRRRALPALVELTAYRVVQEALTNVVRHAEASSARVCLGFCDDELLVEVADDGTAPRSPDGTGFGLRGMAERVGLLGGRLEYGPRVPAGFEVRAHLPLDAGS